MSEEEQNSENSEEETETPQPGEEQVEEVVESSEEPTPEAEEESSEKSVAEAEEESVDEVVEEVVVEEEKAVEKEKVEQGPKSKEKEKKEKPAIPGADLEVDIVLEGQSALEGEEQPAYYEQYDEEGAEAEEEPHEESPVEELKPIEAAIDLAAKARYRATGKRKTSIARVILKPGKGVYMINGREFERHFPRQTLQINVREPIETVGYSDKLDVVAKIHGGGISSQAGALRHGIARALIEADPNLRSELKRRGFLTRDSRVKERRKAGLKKARKKPQFSKR